MTGKRKVAIAKWSMCCLVVLALIDGLKGIQGMAYTVLLTITTAFMGMNAIEHATPNSTITTQMPHKAA